jgi:4-diphosphocytidyl-2-C-methyl-D-erythritol kinase
MTILATERAPAKINLCLFLGPTRADGRHELVTLFDSVGLCDDLEVGSSTRDEAACDEVSGPNLVDDALRQLRRAGWDAPPVRVRIRKRIPVAAGMGGGSADAAAMLRCAIRLGPVPAATLGQIARRLGADVPGQLHPGPSLGTGAGDTLAPAPALPPYAVVVLPQSFPLSTAEVYREADRLGLSRPSDELASLRAQLSMALPAGLIVNDLQPAALSLAPGIDDALGAARDAGADQSIVCGSGPTVIGVFWGADGSDRARAAATRLRGRNPAAVAADPVRRGVCRPTANE